MEPIELKLGTLVRFEDHEYVIGCYERVVRMDGASVTIHAYDPQLYLYNQRDAENKRKIIEQTPGLQELVRKEILGGSPES